VEKNKNKKLLIIKGARQVGKTWLMKKFGEIAYEKTVYINFDNNQQMEELFGTDMKIDRIIRGFKLFKEFKGALTEQYVLQQFVTLKQLKTYYWTNNRGSAEIDFLVDTGEKIVPVEVKAEKNLKAKSLKSYYEKFNPSVSVRTAMIDYKREKWLINIPLWGIEVLEDIIKD
jgi:predicted AAA+ superfamily ATPase